MKQIIELLPIVIFLLEISFVIFVLWILIVMIVGSLKSAKQKKTHNAEIKAQQDAQKWAAQQALTKKLIAEYDLRQLAKQQTAHIQSQINTRLQGRQQNPSIGGIEMKIRYYSESRGEMVEKEILAYGLGRYENRYYVIAHSYEDNERRTYKVAKFRSCINLETGEKITSIKNFLLDYNPNVEDLTDEFNAIKAERERLNGFYN